jgi:class 3 adenylate cyclase
VIEVELPTGTVTLLFTDIEASTRLLRSLGDDYGTPPTRSPPGGP